VRGLCEDELYTNALYGLLFAGYKVVLSLEWFIDLSAYTRTRTYVPTGFLQSTRSTAFIRYTSCLTPLPWWASMSDHESEPTYITPGTYRDLRGPLYTPRCGESRRRSYVHAMIKIHRNSLRNIRVCAVQGKDKFPLIPMSYYSHAKGTNIALSSCQDIARTYLTSSSLCLVHATCTCSDALHSGLPAGG
jgi:hypothetical protein